MSNSRDAIFAKLRESTGRATEATTGTSNKAPSRIPKMPGRLRPQAPPRPDMSGDTVERFLLKVQASGASVDRLRSLDEVADAVQSFLKEHDQRASVVVSDEPAIQGIDWPESLNVECRAANESDQTSVSGAVVAVAESGSVVVKSGKAGANSLAILPDNHITVVMADQLVPHLEDVFAGYVDDTQASSMPRALSFITGPSKTADVEQTLQHGAHGPKRKHVILVG